MTTEMELLDPKNFCSAKTAIPDCGVEMLRALARMGEGESLVPLGIGDREMHEFQWLHQVPEDLDFMDPFKEFTGMNQLKRLDDYSSNDQILEQYRAVKGISRFLSYKTGDVENGKQVDVSFSARAKENVTEITFHCELGPEVSDHAGALSNVLEKIDSDLPEHAGELLTRPASLLVRREGQEDNYFRKEVPSLGVELTLSTRDPSLDFWLTTEEESKLQTAIEGNCLYFRDSMQQVYMSFMTSKLTANDMIADAMSVADDWSLTYTGKVSKNTRAWKRPRRNLGRLGWSIPVLAYINESDEPRQVVFMNAIHRESGSFLEFNSLQGPDAITSSLGVFENAMPKLDRNIQFWSGHPKDRWLD